MKNILCALLCLIVTTGCSSFNKEWRAAEKGPAPTGIEGRWKGEWRSEKNGHHGELRAVVTKTSADTYRAHYHAKYMRVLRFGYVATLHGAETNGVVTLSGDADLGKLAGGVYTYQATATPTKLESTYNSKYDHGRYEMARPADAK